MAELVKSSYSAKNLEIRFNNGAAVPGFKSTPMGEAASLPLSGVDDGYLKRVDHSVRKNLKTARHHGVEIEVTATPSAYLDSYFEMSRHHFTRHHGSPYMPRAFYKGLFSSDHAALAIARQQGTIIGFLMAWHNQRHIQIVEIIGNKDCWHTRFNDLLHFEMIQWAKRSGFDLFDFGSVRYEGQRRYKRKWGVSFTPFTISYLGHLNHMDPDAHWAKMARGIWRHLPLRLTDRLTWYARRLTLQ
ncbi:MAG: GNAT family N-acetyltransferase [Verrucomicrobia bacterium]|nr:GNAT family N-acetyltransferase [Verrucomicrobiota bacterium]